MFRSLTRLATPVKMKMIQSIRVIQRSPRNAGPIGLINIELNCKYEVHKKRSFTRFWIWRRFFHPQYIVLADETQKKFRCVTRMPIVCQRSLLNSPVSAGEREVGGDFGEKAGCGVYVNWRLSVFSTVWEIIWPDVFRICKRVRAWLKFFLTVLKAYRCSNLFS